MKYNPHTQEQIKLLSDGRTIYKTHNGFKYWLKDAKGNSTEVDEAYYKKSKHLEVKTK